MSDIIENIKDALNPKRREEATVPEYDAQKRGPYTASEGQPEQVAPPRAEQTDLSSAGAGAGHTQHSGSLFSQNLNAAEESQSQSSRTATAPDRSPKLASNTGFNAPEGTYGPHKSRVANALDPRVDSDRDGKPSHGVSGYGEAAAQKPVHKEGGVKYGLS
ncbi:hypothetical protein C8A03DRAFT_45245 [Achaetomium macrosporum]|uniref:Uncharacterized protein n=1 Tax=Achaetomium macrosporum TaxID=79813 RepID=A0AAN7C7C7_9PEZI|nr:hypothetical protein C8A03DRAFT_45245 [Achaetomium macrosporum]